MFGTVFTGVTDEDLGSRPGSVSVQSGGLRGRLRAFFVQVGVNILCRRIQDQRRESNQDQEIC